MQKDAEHNGEFWRHLAPHALDPVAVGIVEALRWIDRPLTAVDLVRIFDAEVSTEVVIEHVEQLIHIEVLAVEGTQQVRGARVRSFRLTEWKEEDVDH